MIKSMFVRFGRGLSAFCQDEEGASAIEYALIAAIIAVALITFLTPVRTALGNIFTTISNALTGASSSGGGGT